MCKSTYYFASIYYLQLRCSTLFFFLNEIDVYLQGGVAPPRRCGGLAGFSLGLSGFLPLRSGCFTDGRSAAHSDIHRQTDRERKRADRPNR